MSKEITFLMKVMKGGGAERVISLLTKAFSERNYAVTLIITHQSLSDADLSHINKDITVISLTDEIKKEKKSAFLARLIMLFARLIGKINSEKGSVLKYYSRNYDSVKWLKKFFLMHKKSVAAAFLYDTIFLTLLSRNKTNKVIISERGDPRQSASSKTVAAFMKTEFMKADNIVFQSPDAKKWYEENTPASGTVIFNPVKADLPEPYQGERKKRIVNFCRISAQKNLIMLAEAFSMLHKDYPEFELDIIGDCVGNDAEGYIEKVTERIKQLGCEESVRILPARRDIHDYIKDYAMFVSSSDFEGMSNSMLEAMAIGLPVVCTDCPAGGARAVIKNGENGLLVPVGDAQKTYEAMKTVIENPELAKKISENALNIRNELSVEKIIEKWEKIIND
ncbi:MAG: glycosyltransferase [Clostridia bacterium]|nr:glycosyltransferase [Clostridia bacterium]